MRGVRERVGRAWQSIGHIGVRPLSAADSRSIVSTNQFALVAILWSAPFLAFFVAYDFPVLMRPAVSHAGLIAAWAFAIYLNWHGRFLAASSIAFLAPVVQFTHLAEWFTTASGFHYYLFAGGALSFILFRTEQWTMRIAFMTLAVAALLACEALWPPETADHDISATVNSGLLVANVALTVALLYVVARINLHYYVRERERNVALLEAAQVAAQTDALTEVYNRRGVAPVLSNVARSGDYALALVDLDHFKLINDRLGHGAGDVVLANVARSLVRSIDEYGTVARWGGEEFLVVLPGMTPGDAHELMETVRRDMEQEYGSEDSLARVTISVGLAHAPRYAGKEEALRVADHNLYEAKSSGRNVVIGTRVTSGES